MDSGIQQLMGDGAPFKPLPADTSPSARARQAQYPTKYLASESDEDFFKTMPPRIHSLAVATVAEGINEGKVYMSKLFNHFRAHVERVILIQSIDAAGLAKMYEQDVKVRWLMIKAKSSGVSEAEIARFMEGQPEPRINHLGFRMAISYGPSSKIVEMHEAEAPMPQVDNPETRLKAEENTGDPGHSTRSPISEKTGTSADLGHVVRSPTPLSSVRSGVARGQVSIVRGSNG